MANRTTDKMGNPIKLIDNGDNTYSEAVHVAGINLKFAPLVGVKTVGTVAGELFAGASRLVTRRYMKVYNGGTAPIYYGASGVTTSTGFPIQPGDVEVFTFSDDVPLYFIASANTTVYVEER